MHIISSLGLSFTPIIRPTPFQPPKKPTPPPKKKIKTKKIKPVKKQPAYNK